jgi:hypothetical protein
MLNIKVLLLLLLLLAFRQNRQRRERKQEPAMMKSHSNLKQPRWVGRSRRMCCRRAFVNKTMQGKVFATDADGERLLSSLINLLESDLRRVWRAACEEEFLNLFANAAFRLLDNASVARSKPLRRAVFQILCVLVKRYR